MFEKTTRRNVLRYGTSTGLAALGISSAVAETASAESNQASNGEIELDIKNDLWYETHTVHTEVFTESNSRFISVGGTSSDVALELDERRYKSSDYLSKVALRRPAQQGSPQVFEISSGTSPNSGRIVDPDGKTLKRFSSSEMKKLNQLQEPKVEHFEIPSEVQKNEEFSAKISVRNRSEMNTVFRGVVGVEGPSSYNKTVEADICPSGKKTITTTLRFPQEGTQTFRLDHGRGTIRQSCEII